MATVRITSDRQAISKTFEGGPDHFFERQCADGFNPMLGIIYNRLCNVDQQAILHMKFETV